MIKIYGMKTCPDCTAITEQVKNNNRYEIIDIGEHVRFFKRVFYAYAKTTLYLQKLERKVMLVFLVLY